MLPLPFTCNLADYIIAPPNCKMPLAYAEQCAAFEKFHVVATYNLLYNAAILVREGMGYAISLDKLVNDAELCFRPLEPELQSELRFIWRKDRPLPTPAQILLKEMEKLFAI